MALTDYNPPQTPQLSVLYQDNDIAVLDKPSGLLSVPGKTPNLFDSLKSRAEKEWENVGIVHRLDMSTSGVMVIALNQQSLRALSIQFQDRLTRKQYMALVWGTPTVNSGSIKLPLIVDWPNRPKQKVCYEMGKPSETHWKSLDTKEGISRLELNPITGRSHQLRVHMAEIGHPILGDKFYAHNEAFRKANRLMLHAESLELTHPSTGKRMTFSSPCPF